MKTVLLFFFIFIFSIFSLTAQISSVNPILWLRADSGVVLNGANVTLWEDVSGNGNNISQSDSTNMPTLQNNFINGNAVISFDGDDYLNGGDIINLGTGNSTIFIVCNVSGSSGTIVSKSAYTNASNRYALLKYNNNLTFLYHDSSDKSINVTYPNGSINLFTMVNDKSDSTNLLYVNSNLLGSKNILSVYDFTSNYSFLVGAYNNTSGGVPPTTGLFLNGFIAEILVYDTVFSNIERLEIETQLMDKYSPPVNLGPDTLIQYELCPLKLGVPPNFESCIWSTGQTTDSIEVSSSGVISVQYTDLFGRTSNDTIYVILPSISLPDTAFCLNDTITMNTGLNHAYTFQWSDGSSDSLLKVWAPGEYWVEVTDSTSLACSVRDTFVVVVDSFPVLASLGPDTSLCSGDLFSLQSQSGPGYTYAWSTGSPDSAIVISAPGTYALTVTNPNNCVATDTVHINIKGIKPTALFSYGTVCYGDSTHFVNMSYTQLPDAINSVLYDFNDGDSSVLNNPYHLFASPGDFPVTLQVFSDSGCYADTTISVHVRSLPTADFLPFNGCNGQLINFGDSSDTAEGPIVLWNWDFGDGNYSTSQNPQHVYDSVGVFNTTLIISDIYGCADTVTHPVNVKITPEVDFEYTESCVGTKTYFTELTVTPTYAPIIYRHWDFGDGNYSLLQNPQHQYDNPGTYTVKLKNRSINGCIDSLEKIITVHPFPVAGFFSDTACVGYRVCFTDTSTVQYSYITEREWIFGQGETGFDSISCTTYPDTGSYVVQLTVTSEFGCSSTVDKSIHVYPIPNADFSMSPEYGVPPLDVQFFNYSTGANIWYWDFGDGNYSSTENPLHTYIAENIFNVTLVAENDYTCTDTAFGNVYVIPSSLDLVLTKLNITDSSGYLYLNVEFYNNGTRNIREIAYDARIGNNIPVRETWSGLLLPGQEQQYSFIAAFLKPENENIKTLCVEGAVLDAYGQEDENPEDNTVCYALTDGFFITSVYPSPADDYIYINIALPDDGDVELIVSSEVGKLVRQGLFTDQDEGTLRTRINVQNLAGGVYVIKARYMDKEDVVKFVKK